MRYPTVLAIALARVPRAHGGVAVERGARGHQRTGHGQVTGRQDGVCGPAQERTCTRRCAHSLPAGVSTNPPWVRMADVQNEDRKRQLERFAANRMKIWTGGKQAPHFDIASLFIKRTREQYLAKPGSDPAGWLVKKAALKAGSWNKFRDWHKDVVTQTLDLEPLQPFGGGDARRSCVLLEKRRFEKITDLETREIVASCTKPRPERNDQLDGVRQRLQIDAAKAAISTASSGYLGLTGTFYTSGNEREPLERKESDMTKKRHTPEQIVTLVRQVEVAVANGKGTPQACKEAAITEQTYYRWRKEYGGLKLAQAKRLKELEKENSRLKRVVAELSLEKQILREVAQGNS